MKSKALPALTDLLRVLQRACLAGGRSLLNNYRAQPDFATGEQTLEESLRGRHKNPDDPRTVVSAADLESEKVIVETLQTEFGCNCLSEEAGEIAGDGRTEYRAIIDSLDGSRNFLNGTLGLFGISIAIEHQSRIVAGAIYLPWYDEILLAERGNGAFYGSGFRQQKHAMRKIPMTFMPREIPQLNKARVFVGRGAAKPHVLADHPVSMLIRSCGEVLNYASCSVGLFSLALSKIDGFVLYRQSYWDFAAGCCILRELGMPFEFSRGSWTSTIDEPVLARSAPSERSEIVAARSMDLFAEINRILKQSETPDAAN